MQAQEARVIAKSGTVKNGNWGQREENSIIYVCSSGWPRRLRAALPSSGVKPHFDTPRPGYKRAGRTGLIKDNCGSFFNFKLYSSFQSAKSISRLLQSNVSLRSLNLACNAIGAEGCRWILFTAQFEVNN